MPLRNRTTLQATTVSMLYSVANDFSPTEAAVFGSFAASLSVFTVVSNAVVIHLTRTSSELRPLGPLRSLLGSMAWGDLFMGLIVMPLTGQYNILEEWIFGEFGCMLFVCTEIVCAGSTALHLSAIAIDRYLAIMYPIMYKNFGRGYVRFSVSFAWTLSLLIMVPTMFFGWLRFWQDEDGRDQCEIPQNQLMGLLVSGLIIGIPYLIIWSIYIRLYCMNRRRLRDRISKTMKTYQDITLSRNMNNSNDINDDQSSDSDEEKHGVRIGCMPQIPTVFRTNFQGTKVCLGCNAKIPFSGIKSGLCQVCRAPNDLLAAATRSRLNVLMKMNRKTLFVTLIVTSTFTVCYVPIGTQFQIGAMCPSCRTTPRLTTTLFWIALSMSAADPIIYGVFNSNFQRALKKFLNC